MKFYKGLYYNDKSTAPSFEHGAHFKYLDLVNALQKLQDELSSKIDIQNLETNYSPVKNDILVVDKRIKKHKKYRLSTKILNTEKKDNQRYKLLDSSNNGIENEKNENKIEENDEINKDSIKAIKKRHHHMKKDISRSIDKNLKKLPIINNHNSVSLNKKSLNSQKYLEKIIYDYENNENEDNNRYKDKDDDDKVNVERIDLRNKLLGKSKKHHKKHRNNVIHSTDVLPKINSFYYQQKIKQEQENENNDKDINEYIEKEKENELKNTIDVNNNIQIYQPRKKNSHNKFSTNLYIKDISNTRNDIFDMKKSRKEFDNYKLKSIFETEKQIKDNKNYIETINNEMARQIHHLKKNLLSERIKKEKDFFINSQKN
jgi:hypothetical protein